MPAHLAAAGGGRAAGQQAEGTHALCFLLEVAQHEAGRVGEGAFQAGIGRPPNHQHAAHCAAGQQGTVQLGCSVCQQGRE
jgi:hypothetical protein